MIFEVLLCLNIRKKYVPGCENAKLLQSGNTLGIRETRHIEGIKILTLDVAELRRELEKNGGLLNV